MESRFPICDGLFAKAMARSAPVDREVLKATLESLSGEQRDHVALILIHYYYSAGGTGDPFHRQKKVELPFDLRMNTTGKGCSFELDKCPEVLVKTLCEFVGI